MINGIAARTSSEDSLCYILHFYFRNGILVNSISKTAAAEREEKQPNECHHEVLISASNLLCQKV